MRTHAGGPHERGCPAQPVAGVAATRPRDRWGGRALRRAGGLRDGERGALGRPGDHDERSSPTPPRCSTSRTPASSPRRGAGPYWFDVDSIRSDIREGRPGLTLALALRVHDPRPARSAAPSSRCRTRWWRSGTATRGCLLRLRDDRGRPPRRPVHRAQFERCARERRPRRPQPARWRGPGDAPGWSGESSDGSYSSGDPEATPTDDGTYLRGAQATDANGVVRFTTIFPGWYVGRTTHIRCKVHIDRRTVLTTQLFVDDNVTDAIYLAVAPLQGATAARHPQRHRLDLRRRHHDDAAVGRRPARRDQSGPEACDDSRYTGGMTTTAPCRPPPRSSRRRRTWRRTCAARRCCGRRSTGGPWCSSSSTCSAAGRSSSAAR